MEIAIALIAGLALGVVAASLLLRARRDDVRAAESLVAPVTEQLRGLQAQVQGLEKDRHRTEGEMGKMFETLTGAVGELRRETGQLVSALKRPQVRGAWGEMQLRNVVRAANMTEHVDFRSQPTLAGDGEEARLRPDMVIHLPTGRDVVVDSKVPLEAYLAATEAEEDGERDALLDRHAAQLRSHLDALAAKSYHAYLESPAEFVVCFLPNEAIYSAALDRDPTLLEHGAAKGVLIATPATLLALLYACRYGWQQERIEESAREISEAARELHRRCAKFAEDFSTLGRRLGSTVNAFNAATGSLESRVLPQLRRIEESGASSERAVSDPSPVDTPPRMVTAPEAGGEPPDEDHGAGTGR